METTLVLGYFATSASVIGYGSQFIHTIRTKTISGLSLNRTILETVSLTLWVVYAARLEDIPLLTATSCELFMSLCVCVLIIKQNRKELITVGTESSISTKETADEICIVDVKPERRNSI